MGYDARHAPHAVDDGMELQGMMYAEGPVTKTLQRGYRE